jgi:hypothetical protein
MKVNELFEDVGARLLTRSQGKLTGGTIYLFVMDAWRNGIYEVYFYGPTKDELILEAHLKYGSFTAEELKIFCKNFAARCKKLGSFDKVKQLFDGFDYITDDGVYYSDSEIINFIKAFL